jgi:DNA-binding transcriptional LysR family regulator
VIPAWSIFNLREYLTSFIDKHPNIKLITTRHSDVASALYALLSGKLDFVIMREFLPSQHNLEVTFLSQDNMIVVLPKSHPLAGKGNINLSEIKDVTLMARPLLQEILLSFCKNLGYCALKLVEYDDRREAVLARIAFGNGNAIFYESDLAPYNLSDVSISRLDGLPPTPLVIVSAKDRRITDYQRKFKDYLVDALSKHKMKI